MTSKLQSKGQEEKTDPNELFIRNKPFAVWVVNTHFPNLRGDDDIYQTAFLGLWKACLTYDEEASRFSTYAFIVIRNEINMELRHRKKWQCLSPVSIDEELNEDGFTLIETLMDPRLNEFEDEIYLMEAIKCLKLTEREEKVLDLTLKSVKQRDIGALLDIRQPTVSRYLYRIKEKIKFIL